jgi:CheY-like chemotaxis protein
MNPKFKKIMILDDNEFDSYITTKLIQNSNLATEVIEFSSAKLALEFLAENQNNTKILPDLILVDIYMPLMDGFEFIEKFKELSAEANSYCKICIVSTTVNDYYIHKAKIDENIRFTSKPITTEFLSNLN